MFSTFCTTTNNTDGAMNAAKDADAIVITIGIDQGNEREGRDRTDLMLPGKQNDLVKNITSTVSGKPIVVIVLSGGCVDISDVENNKNVNGMNILRSCCLKCAEKRQKCELFFFWKGIFWNSYGGQYAGLGVANAIFGKYNPGGKVTQTWYKQPFVDEVRDYI